MNGSNDKNIVDLKDIKAIIDLMRKNSVSEFELEKEGFKIRLKRGPNGGPSGGTADDAPVLSYVQPAIAIQAPAFATVPAPRPADAELEVKSPMIGTLRMCRSQNARPAVERYHIRRPIPTPITPAARRRKCD